MTTNTLHTHNPELLHYTDDKLHISILGGIKLTGLDRLKVTLKIVRKDKLQNVFRHNVDLYNSIQTGQLVERCADILEVNSSEVSTLINHLTTALEDYRAAHLESLKPKPQEKVQLTEVEHKAAVQFLKAPELLKRTAQVITQSGIIGEELNSLIAYLIFTSRKRETPLHLMCMGASGSGKTWLQEKVGELIPEEDKLEITTLSNNAFYYFGAVIAFDQAHAQPLGQKQRQYLVKHSEQSACASLCSDSLLYSRRTVREISYCYLLEE